MERRQYSILRAAGAGPSVPASSLMTGLVGFWKLDNTSDSGPSGLTLTNNNAATFTAGRIGNALTTVAASAQYLSLAAQTLGFSNAWTVSLWYKSATGNHNEGMVQIGANGAAPSNNFIKLESDYVYVANSTSGASAFVNGLTVGTSWINRIVSWDGSTVRIYENNVQFGTGTALAGAMADSSRPIYIGTDSNGSPPLENYGGQMADLGIWSRVLTPTERATLNLGTTTSELPFT